MKNSFLDIFYNQKLIFIVLDALKQPPTSNKALKECQNMARHFCLDLLTHCAKCHGPSMRHFIIENALFSTLSFLFRDPCKFVRLSIVRLLRACIGSKDEPISRHIIKNDVFAHIFDLISLKSKDNIISSAILDLFDFIAKQNLKSLIVYLNEKHKEHILTCSLSSAPIMKLIIGKYSEALLAKEPKLTETALTALGYHPIHIYCRKRSYLNYPAVFPYKTAENSPLKKGEEIKKASPSPSSHPKEEPYIDSGGARKVDEFEKKISTVNLQPQHL